MAASVSQDPAAGDLPSTPTSPGKRRRSWFTPGEEPVKIELAVEPPSPEPKPDPNEEIETLLLTHFTCPPKIDFGTLRPGGSVLRHLRVRNPNEYEQEIVVERFPTKKDFHISDTEVCVEAESEILLTLTWNPSECGNYRETALFKVDGAFRLQATLMGRVVEPPKPKKVRKTWAMKPKIAPHVLKSSTKGNTCRPAPTSKQNPPRTAVKPSFTRKPDVGKAMRVIEAPVKTNSNKLPLQSIPQAPVPPGQGDVHVYLNTQQPVSSLPQGFSQHGSEPLAPLDSPSQPRRSTFEKTSPEMHNTPTIATPPERVRPRLMQPRRLVSERTPSPLASVKENQPPIMFCDENSPQPFRVKSKMRRSNTYTKANEDQQDSPVVTSPTDSTCSPLISDQDNTVIECTQVIEATDVTEIVTTHITEEVIETEEMCEYLVKDSPNSGVTYTEVSRTSNPVGRHLFSAQHTDTRVMHNLDVFDATRVIRPGGDVSYCDGRSSMPHQPNFATFVKSPGKDLSILSETQSINHSQTWPMSETYRVSNAHDAYPNLLSQTNEAVHRPSPRRFFSDLLAIHDEALSEESGHLSADKIDSKLVKIPTPDTRRVSSLTVTKDPTPKVNRNDSVDFPSKRELFESPKIDINPRRFSTLTVTKQQPVLNNSQNVSPVNPRRISSLTVTKNEQPQTPPRSSGGRNIFGPDSPRTLTVFSDSLGAQPLPSTPSPGRKSPYELSPTGQSPYRVKIHGTNYPGSRSPRQLPVEEHGWSPSPKKRSPKKEKIKRRSSGRFRRRSSPQKSHGSLVARGVLKNESTGEEKVLSSDDTTMSLTELLSDESPQQHTIPPSEAETLKIDEVPLQQVPLQQVPLQQAQAKPKNKASLKKPLPKLKPLPNYLRPTSSTNRRKDAVADTKKRDHSIEKQPVSKKTQRTETQQGPAPKRAKSDENQQSVLKGLTKTQLLRRKAALSEMNKENKPAPKKVKPRVKPGVPKPGVAQGKLQLIKATTKTALPKHPMAFAAKNVYYDERWKQKQERGFVRWLNFVLTPHEEEFGEALKPKKIDAGALCLNSSIMRRPLTEDKLAPSRETLSFRLYSARRRLNRLRRHACKLFTSDTMVHFHKKLEVEVDCQRILVRPDRKIHADLGIKQRILDLLLSYNPLWLRIGLEAIYGEVLPLASNSDALGLSRFILTRVLANPDIAAEFAHPTVPHLYREGYDKALAQFTLKKFLLLVVFLDMAKTSRLIDHDPCLFCKDSEHKGSRDLLLVFSRDYLSGEGDLGKHITYMGYTVTHIQTPLDELDYAITNLATDLRDGTRLTRLIALLSERWTLTNKLRVPAISRLQKIHNTDVAFRIMLELGLDFSTVKGGKIDPRDIVDGHMEKTHSLLWQIIFNFQVEMVLDERQLEEEIRLLRASLIVKDKMEAILRDDIEALGIPESRRQSTDTDMYFKSPRLSLLLKWCRAVCAFYNVKVENFTVSFSDGRVLCYLIHHYHPGLLQEKDIQSETTQTVGPGEHNNDSINSESGDDSFTGYWTNSFSPSTGKAGMWDSLLTNERENFRLLHESVRELGDIPDMIWASDMSNTIPDEKVVITYVTYLCARLLDIRQEARAARIIQVAWRRYRLKGQKQNLERRYMAACKIQRAVRKYLERRREERRLAAVLVLQAAYRGMKARRITAKMRMIRIMAGKEKSAIKIQALVRCWLVRRRLRQQSQAATAIQAWWRMERAQQNFLRMKTAVNIIEEYYLSTKQGRLERTQYLEKRAAAVHIQAKWRAYSCQKNYLGMITACVVIQRRYRAYRSAQQHALQYKAQKQAVVTLQAAWRGCLERRRLGQQRRAVVTLQKHVRRVLAQRECWIRLGALITIQAYVRSWIQWSQYEKLRSATIIIQKRYRGFAQRRSYLRQKEAVKTLQRYYRAKKLSTLQKADYEKSRDAVITIQRCYRNYKVKREYLNMRRNVIKLQAVVRGFLTRKQLRVQAVAATKIQTRVRAYMTRQKYLKIKSAVIILQTRLRAELVCRSQRREFLLKKKAVVSIQSGVRGVRVRRDIEEQHNAATVLQAAVRGHRTRKEFMKLKRAASTIQTAYRARLQMKEERRKFLTCKVSAVTIQAAVRSYFVRKDIRRMHRAATVIQAHFRQHVAKRNFQMKVKAALVIQEHYRAVLLKRRERKSFLKQKSAAITLQTAFRSYLTRKEETRNSSATIIQAAFRGYRTREVFLRKKTGVCLIQRFYRSVLLKRQVRRSFLICKGAAITIQSAVRSYLVRKEIGRKSRAATLIQSAYRQFTARRDYLAKREAVRVLQKAYRASVIQKQDRRRFLKQKEAVIVLQSALRSYIVRKQLRREHRAATVIQAMFRKYSLRKKFTQKKRACYVIQRHYRARLLQKRDQRDFLVKKLAVVLIQSVFRSYKVRKDLTTQRHAATLIQSIFRQYSDRRRYQRVKEASRTIQLWYRSLILKRRDRRDFLVKRKASILIQAAVRSYFIRKGIAEKHQAATKIQSVFRCYSTRRSYLMKKAAVHTIQTYYQAVLLRRCYRRQFLIKKGAAITIQAVFRGNLVRKDIEKKHRAATVVQSYYRAHAARQHFIRLKSAAVIIQTHFRAHLLRQMQLIQDLVEKRAAITIQCVVRGHLARETLKRKKQAATTIQSAWRGFLAKKLFTQLKTEALVEAQRESAALSIQTAFRGYLARKKFQKVRTATITIQSYLRCLFICRRQREAFLVQKQAAVRIQSTWRGYVSRRVLMKQNMAASSIQAALKGYITKKRYLSQKVAVSLIQSHFRAYIKGKQERRRFLLQKEAATTIQAFVRSYLVGRYHREQFLKQKQAAIKLQSAWRGYITRQEIAEQHMAATAIQSSFRRYVTRKRYLRLKLAASVIQSYFRAKCSGKLERRKFLLKKGAAITIQAFVRGYCVRKEIQMKHQAATAIQAMYRCHVARERFLEICSAILTIQSYVRSLNVCRYQRQQFLKQKQAAIKLQSAWRGYIARQEIAEKHMAATAIQSTFRSYIMKKRYLKQKLAASVIQSRFRAYMVAKHERRRFLLQKGAALTIQAFLRSYMVRREIQLKHRAATTIQAMFKCHKTRQSYLRKLEAVRVVQRHFRSYRIAQSQRQDFLHKKQSVCKLQAGVRGFLARKRFVKERRAAVTIQSAYLAYKARRNFARRLKRREEAVTLIQRYYRAYQEKKLVKLRVERRRVYLQRATAVTRKYLSVIKIQRAFRKHVTIKRALAQVQSVIIIQRWFRCRLAHMRFRRMLRSIVLVQRAARAYIARRQERLVKVQAVVRGWLVRRRIQRTNTGVTKVQALWRAYKVRKAVRSVKVKTARRRVEAARAAVTDEKKLGNITTSALDFLLRYTQLAAILDALMKLDVATRWSSACCELMAASNATHVIFTLIRSCNRSLPHIEVIKYSINVLLNLTKYEKTSSCVFDQEDSVETLVNLLSIFRDKGPVFTKTCTLLGLLCYPNERREKVIKMPKIVSKIQSVHALTARKYAMEERRNLVKAKMAASKSLSCSMMSNSGSARPHVPRIEPEWVLRRRSVREINDPLQSTKFLLNCLRINPK